MSDLMDTEKESLVDLRDNCGDSGEKKKSIPFNSDLKAT